MTYEEALKRTFEQHEKTGVWHPAWNFVAVIYDNGVTRTIDPISNPDTFKKAWGSGSPFINLSKWVETRPNTHIINLGVYYPDRLRVLWAGVTPCEDIGKVKFNFSYRVSMELLNLNNFDTKLLHYNLELTKDGETHVTKINPETMESVTFKK